MPSRLIVIGAGALLVLGLGVLLVGWWASDRLLHPGTARAPWTLADYPQLRPERVRVHSRTGVNLTGRFFRGRDGATVILTHGYASSQDEMLPVANAFHTAGFNVFTYDLRGCGASGGTITLGALEQDDLRSVVDVVARRRDVDPTRIGALGVSLGASTTILEAAGDPRVKAVLADSGWADVRHWLRPRWRDVILHPRGRTPLALAMVELRAGIDLDKLRPVEVIGRISPRPILLIHGTADQAVPPSDSESNYAAAGAPRYLWIVPGASHGDTIRPGGATSSARAVAFFEHALRVGLVGERPRAITSHAPTAKGDGYL